MNETIDTLYGRTNDDVVDFVSQLGAYFVDIEANVAGCQESTKSQVADMVAITSQSQANVDSNVILANLEANKKGIEMLMAKLKMRGALHDYMEFGYSLGEVYVTLTGTQA